MVGYAAITVEREFRFPSEIHRPVSENSSPACNHTRRGSRALQAMCPVFLVDDRDPIRFSNLAGGEKTMAGSRFEHPVRALQSLPREENKK